MVVACGSAAPSSPTPFSRTVAPATVVESTDNEMPSAPASSTSSPVPTQTSLPGLEAAEQPATAPSETPQEILGPAVTVGGTTFPVELAITVDQQIQGLSDRSSLALGTGMLFVYEKQSKLTFWMKDMRFSLDMVWIGADCTVVGVTLNAPPPAPGQTDEQLPRFSPGVAARYVLEINAGEVDSESVAPGDPVEFTGSLAGRYGC